VAPADLPPGLADRLALLVDLLVRTGLARDLALVAAALALVVIFEAWRDR
jgi:hypothetical protein